MTSEEVQEKIDGILINKQVNKSALVSDNIIMDLVMSNGETIDSLEWMDITLELENEFSIEITEEDQVSLYGGSVSNLYAYVLSKIV